MGLNIPPCESGVREITFRVQPVSIVTVKAVKSMEELCLSIREVGFDENAKVRKTKNMGKTT